MGGDIAFESLQRSVFVRTSHTTRMMALFHSSLFAFLTCFQSIPTLLTWFLFLTQVDAQNTSREVDILCQFSNEIGETRSINYYYGDYLNYGEYFSTWNCTDTTPCRWQGVTCNNNGTVYRLDLSNWGLGSPSNWVYLSNLQDLLELDLSFNGLNGTIPDYIQNFAQLTRLDLSSNKFTGMIPRNISACRKLQYLYFQNNQLSGEIPSLGGLVSLKVLILADNNLTGQFPGELGHITSLQHIDLSDNMLNGMIPSLSNLISLLHLKLDNNSFAKFHSLFPGTKNLGYLSVSGNQLGGRIPPGIAKLPKLRILNMSSNLLSGDFPSELLHSNNSLPLIWLLDLSNNQLTGTIPPHLLQLPQLELLNLSHNSLTGGIPFNEINANLSILDLSNNHLSGYVPSFFYNESTTINLLYLQNNQLSGDIVDLLLANDSAAARSLSVLRVSNNFFTGDLSWFANTNKTTWLWQSFSIVDLSNNHLTMSTTGATNPLSGVLEFFVGSTYYTDYDYEQSGLQAFYLGGNNFSGISLSAYWNTNLSQYLEVLDLSNSHLKGEILDSLFNITELPALQYLNLSHNDATGPIPESVLLLPSLQVLDVTYNDLSGPLPNISTASRLYNRSFYDYNPGLCGPPLPPCPQGGTRIQWWIWIIVSGFMIIVFGSCLATTWKWREYRKKHLQDADLIRTLLERESTALMSLRELRKATNNFVESAQIGEGGFGIVYKGKLSDGTLVAIKKSKQEGADKDKQQFLNEVRILSQVNHRNLVKLLGCCMENKIALLVFEFISNGTLLEHLQGKFGGVRLTWSQRLRVAVQTVDALHYLHSAATFPIYHRDVKSSNILLDDDFNAKVADFGISRLVPGQATHVSTAAIQGTMGYIDPEYYTSLQLTDKSDVYSFGVVLLELISSKRALDCSRGGNETSLVIFALPSIETGNLQQLLDPSLLETYNDPTGHGKESILNMGRLAMKCLETKSKARPSMNEVRKELQNLWFELDGASKRLDSINEDSQHDDKDFLFQSFGNCSSSDTLHNDGSGIQMSQF